MFSPVPLVLGILGRSAFFIGCWDGLLGSYSSSRQPPSQIMHPPLVKSDASSSFLMRRSEEFFAKPAN